MQQCGTLEASVDQNLRQRICIVTPDVIGPVRNGGIGTHCFYLACELARQAETQVTIFFTGPYETGSRAACVALYSQHGIEFCDFEDAAVPSYKRLGCEWFLDRSLRVMEFLARQDFTQVHFQDWQANGFSTIQAKRTGIGFHNTHLTVTLHSSTQWVREGMRAWPENPIQDAMLDYCERYVAEHADLVISPSQYMLHWAQSKNWKLSKQQRVIPYCFQASERRADVESKEPVDLSHLIFFGRLETRKGLELFSAALERLLSSGIKHGIKKVSFLGKPGNTQYGYGALTLLEKLQATLKTYQVELCVISNLSSQEAIDYLLAARGVVFICSLQDNYPFTVIECLENNIPFVASNTGGIPEMLNDGALFVPSSAGILEAIENRGRLISACSSKYDSKKASAAWRAVAQAKSDSSSSSFGDTPAENKRVSVCVAYYNYGKYLPQLLQSLAQNAYPNFEVVVVNDGSTDAFSNEVFTQLREQYSGRGWKFVAKGNEGIGATRNFAASLASGDYIIFMDADNIACPQMIESFVRAIERAQVDCLSCYFTAFEGDEAPIPGFQPSYGFTPLGPCLEVGPIANVFGDANFCIKRAVFKSLGGFNTERGTSYEDYEFLARLTLHAYSLDVVPAVLFYYRHLESGFSRATNSVSNQHRVNSVFIRHVDKLDGNRLFNVLLTPLAKQVEHFAEDVRALHGERADLKRQIAELQRQLACYDRFGYRSTTKILNILDSSPGIKYVLRDSFKGLAKTGRWAAQVIAGKGGGRAA